jgi:uncharacterized membrane protein YgcG
LAYKFFPELSEPRLITFVTIFVLKRFIRVYGEASFVYMQEIILSYYSLILTKGTNNEKKNKQNRYGITMKKRINKIGMALIGLSLIVTPVWAADYSSMTTEELSSHRGTMRETSQEEHTAFQQEWQSRVQQMPADERQQYTGSYAHANNFEYSQNEGMGGGGGRGHGGGGGGGGGRGGGNH